MPPLCLVVAVAAVFATAGGVSFSNNTAGSPKRYTRIWYVPVAAALITKVCGLWQLCKAPAKWFGQVEVKEISRIRSASPEKSLDCVGSACVWST